MLSNDIVTNERVQFSKLTHLVAREFPDNDLALDRLNQAYEFAAINRTHRASFTKLDLGERLALPLWFAAWQMLDDAKYLLPNSTTEQDIIAIAEDTLKGFQIELETAIQAATYGGKDDDSLISLELARLITLSELSKVYEDVYNIGTSPATFQPVVELLVAIDTKINRILEKLGNSEGPNVRYHH